MKEHSFYWLKHFRDNTDFGNYRFKKLEKGFCGYPPFDFDDSILDTVDLETFIKVEKNRVPLFIGTQFGRYPWFTDFQGFYNEERIIAVLSRSLLSGQVVGLALYSTKVDPKCGEIQDKEIVNFKNIKS